MIKNFLTNASKKLLMKNEISIITGALGEIGKNLIPYFSKFNNKKIVALDLNKPNKKINVFEFIRGSILDVNLLEQINKKYIIREIFHLAAVLSTKAEKNKALAQEVNINGTTNLFKLALSQYSINNIKTKIFFPSSIAVYNVGSKINNLRQHINEAGYCNPKTVYGQHKLYCENLGVALNDYGNEQKARIDFRCIRFPGIISTNSIPTGGTSDYAPEMIHHAFNKTDYTCFVNAESCLPFIVMPDAINAIIKIMDIQKKDLNGSVYNITSFSPTVSNLFDILKNKFPKFKLNYNIDKMRQSMVDGWPSYIDDSLAKNDWNWEAEYNLKKAFNNYIIPNFERN